MLIRSLMILDDSDRRDQALDHYLTLDLNGGRQRDHHRHGRDHAAAR